MNIRISQLKTIRRRLSVKTCPVHKKRANVTVIHNNIELKDFCCSEFDTKLHEKAKALIIKQVEANNKEKAQKNKWKP